MAQFVNPFGNQNTNKPAGAGTTSTTSVGKVGGFVNPFAGYTPPKPTQKPQALGSNGFPTASIVQPQQQPQQPQNLLQTIFTKAAPVVGQTLDFAKGLAKQVVDFIPKIPNVAKSNVKNPGEAIAGAGEAALTTFSSLAGIIEHGIASVAKVTVPERWDISKQTGALKELDQQLITKGAKTTGQAADKQTAFATGQFLGQLLPYALGSEVAGASVGAKLLTPTAEKFLPAAVKFVPTINNAIGFLGIGQITHDPQNGSRIDQFKSDLINLALFETGGIVLKGITKGTSKLITKTVDEVKDKPKVDFEVTQPKVEEVKTAIKTETGKPLEVNVAQQLATGNPSVITREQRVQVQSNISKVLAKADTPEKMSKIVDAMIEPQTKDVSKLKVIRAQLVKEMKNMSGASTGYYKSDFAHIEKMKQDAVMGPFLDNIQNGINKIDKIISEAPVETTKSTNLKSLPFYQPTGEGITKASTLGLKVEQTAVEKKLTSELSDLPQYQQLNMKEQATKASEFINKDPEKAMRVALGQEAPPEGLLPETVFKAVEGSITTPEQARRLATSPLVSQATALGQKIKALDVKISDSPVEAIKQVIDARAKALEVKYRNIDKATSKVVNDIQKNVKIPDKYAWNTFIESVKC